MPTVVTTPGSATANSYATVAEIDTYAEATAWSASWAAASDDLKASLAIRSTRALEILSFSGYPTTSTQALFYPAQEVPDRVGGTVASDVVPKIIKNAQAHIAAYLATFATTEDPFSLDGTGKFESLSVGPVSLHFRQGVGADGASFLLTVIVPMLRPWGLLAASGSVRLVR